METTLIFIFFAHRPNDEGGVRPGHADGVCGRPRSRKDGCDVAVRCLQVPRLRRAATAALRKVQGPVVLQQRLSGEAGTVSLLQPGLRVSIWGVTKANTLERVIAVAMTSEGL